MTLPDLELDPAVFADLIRLLEQAITDVGALTPLAATDAAAAAVPDSAAAQAIRDLGRELRSTLNETRIAAAVAQDRLRDSRTGFLRTDQEQARRAFALNESLSDGMFGGRPPFASVRTW